MPLLASAIIAAISGIASILAELFGKKLAIAVAAVSAFGVLTVALMAAMSAALSGLVTAFPTPAFSTMVWVCFPPEVSTAVAVGISTDVAVALYRWNADNVSLMAQS